MYDAIFPFLLGQRPILYTLYSEALFSDHNMVTFIVLSVFLNVLVVLLLKVTYQPIIQKLKKDS